MAKLSNRKMDITINQTRLDILLGNYRESREEGIRLVHSGFTDIAIFVGLIGAIIGGEKIINEPALLLILPPLLACFGLYAMQKFRISSLVTSYLIYLENEINVIMSENLMIWNSVIISRNISAARKSTSGNLLLFFISIIATSVYAGSCVWVYSKNSKILSVGYLPTIIYVVFCVILILVSWANLYSTWRIIKEYIPSKISALTIQFGTIPVINKMLKKNKK
jgi:hypothetical protein